MIPANQVGYTSYPLPNQINHVATYLPSPAAQSNVTPWNVSQLTTVKVWVKIFNLKRDCQVTCDFIRLKALLETTVGD